MKLGFSPSSLLFLERTRMQMKLPETKIAFVRSVFGGLFSLLSYKGFVTIYGRQDTKTPEDRMRDITTPHNLFRMLLFQKY